MDWHSDGKTDWLLMEVRVSDHVFLNTFRR